MSENTLSFDTQYRDHRRVWSVAGERERVLFSPVFDSDGNYSLVESGRESLYDYIQSHKDSVDIHVILKRFEAGDASVLTRVQGAYGDFTQMPKTYAEALNSMIAAEQYFMSLPVEVRARFDHSFQVFLSSFDKPDFAQRFRVDPTPETVAAAAGQAAGAGSGTAPASAGANPQGGVAE